MRTPIKSLATLAIGISLCGATGYFLYLLFKKDTDDDYNETIPISVLQSRVELKIPKDAIRAVIGRSGFKIREIEKQTNCKICFKEQNSEEDFRVCIIRGEASGCGLAESLIQEVVANQPSIVVKELWVPRVAVGRIIGRCGERINYITQLSGAKCNVSEIMRNESSEVRIIIKGTNDQYETARSYIIDVVKEDMQVRKKIEDRLALREPRGKPKGEQKLNDAAMKQSHEKLTTNLTGGDGQMEVYVSAVVDPSQFWLQIVGPKANELDQLVEEMTDYYSKQENQEAHAISDPCIGDIVAAVFMNDGKWYRAEIVELKIENDRPVGSLYFLDYGDTDVSPVEEIFELRTDFLRLRFQAIECYLARVKPAEDVWTDDSINKFEEWTQVAQWKKLRARVSGYTEREALRGPGRAKREGSPIPGVDLYDISQENDLDIALELVKNGFAVLDDLPDSRTKLDSSTTSISSRSLDENDDHIINDYCSICYADGDCHDSRSSGYLSSSCSSSL